MFTVFQNLRARGTLVVVGLATLGTIVGTLATITTINSTTINVQTLSGSTITARQANGIVRAVTVSGSTITRSGIGAGVGQAACFKTAGVIGYCSNTPTNGTCTCN